MDSLREFVILVLALFMFGTNAVPAIYDEVVEVRETLTIDESGVESASGKAEGDLSIVRGSDVIGMVQYALGGEYGLVIDGVLIDETTDIRYVDLRGVVGNNYGLSILRGTYGEVIRVTAIRM